MNARQQAAAAEKAGDLQAAAYWTAIADTVDAAPPFTPALRDKLRVLLRPQLGGAPATPHSKPEHLREAA